MDSSPEPDETRARLRLVPSGLVQGVGFRPFVFRLAHDLGLAGFVRNTPAGAWIEVEGTAAALTAFRHRLTSEPPPPCRIDQVTETWLAPAGLGAFEIVPSDSEGRKTALILPDLAMCRDCRQEVSDPANRRHRYPFTNCTQCGPRYSIVLALPYDRVRTTMAGFALCASCRAEYEDPRNRRFHAEPTACPACGPQTALWTPEGRELHRGDDAIRAAAEALNRGLIVALKALGGFQLLVRADDDDAVRRLRQRKGREAKPLAVMCPTTADVATWTSLSPAETRLLESPAAPIVLARRCDLAGPAPSVAMDSPWLGVMLASTPLHHVLLSDLRIPVVATSGNRSDEPLCIDELDALSRLHAIADLFLVHNRPIARPIDDSVTCVVLGSEQILRRARGYTPLPIALPDTSPPTPGILALGAHLKSTIAVGRGRHVFLSQHLGDLETIEAAACFHRTINDLPRLLDITPEAVATDRHPDYLSTQAAGSWPGPRFAIAHHEAHAYACLADNDLAPPVLALTWDGTGLGPDGTLWGGEFLEITDSTCRRRARFRPFALPGGDRASRDSRRCALGALVTAGLHPSTAARRWLETVWSPRELPMLIRAIERGVNAPLTSSLGRLFDAIASLLGVAHESRFEGDAAMRLESSAWRAFGSGHALPYLSDNPVALPLRDDGDLWTVDWAPFMTRFLDAQPLMSADSWAWAWHHAVVKAAVAVAQRVGQTHVLLTGGCFQNRLLTEHCALALRDAGFQPHWHHRIPPNDGGIAVGQTVGATLARMRVLPTVAPGIRPSDT